GADQEDIAQRVGKSPRAHAMTDENRRCRHITPVQAGKKSANVLLVQQRGLFILGVLKKLARGGPAINRRPLRCVRLKLMRKDSRPMRGRGKSVIESVDINNQRMRAAYLTPHLRLKPSR